MIIYHVTISLETGIEAEWIEWMNRVHVPDVLRTGCFSSCQISQVIGPEGEGPAYVLQYRCRSLEEYHRYRDNFAPALQKEHSGRYSGRFHGSRQILEEMAAIDAG